MQTNVAVGSNHSITGTSHYVTDYTGFSSRVEEQSGNYLAVKATAVDGATIVFNGLSDVTLDSDGMIVIRLRDGVESLRFTATKDDVTQVVEYSIRNLTKESEIPENAVLTELGEPILTEGGEYVLTEEE